MSGTRCRQCAPGTYLYTPWGLHEAYSSRIQTGIDRRVDRIEQLERAIQLLELRLESGTLTPDEELASRLRIERNRNAIEDLQRANLADRREAATSELALVLHTREAAAKEEQDEGGAAGRRRRARLPGRRGDDRALPRDRA